MTALDDSNEVISGPLWPGRNWAASAGSGSIHDDATATELGFRGGTVPGDVHMNQFVPVLLEAFGDDWWQRGFLQVDFKAATVDLEPVRASVRADGSVAMHRDDGLLVCIGRAGLGSLPVLDDRRARPADQAPTQLLARVRPGLSLGIYPVLATATRQFERYDAGVISDPLPIYRSGFDGAGAQVPACPSTLVEFLWGPPMDGLRPLVSPDAVGLFGAIDIGHVQGPMLLGRRYTVSAEVVAVGDSPKTEFLWFESTARDDAGAIVVQFRMMLRFMKASVPAD